MDPRLHEAELHLRRADPVLARVMAANGPCLLGAKASDPFHILCKSIISQQLSTKAADTIHGRVRAALRADPHFAPHHFHGVRHARLRACGLSNAKAQWLRAIAAQVRSGAFSFAALDALDDEAAIEALDALPGIGRWTAEMFLMFSMGRLDIFAMDDVGLRRGVDRLYGKGRKLSDRRTREITRRWAPYRSVASWHLWRMADTAGGAWS